MSLPTFRPRCLVGALLAPAPASAAERVAHDQAGQQLTLGGWPLYWFVDDRAPGDATGENVGGNWSAVGPDGRALRPK